MKCSSIVLRILEHSMKDRWLHISAILARYRMKTRQKVCDIPLRYYIENILPDREVSRTGPAKWWPLHTVEIWGKWQETIALKAAKSKSHLNEHSLLRAPGIKRSKFPGHLQLVIIKSWSVGFSKSAIRTRYRANAENAEGPHHPRRTMVRRDVTAKTQKMRKMIGFNKPREGFKCRFQKPPCTEGAGQCRPKVHRRFAFFWDPVIVKHCAIREDFRVAPLHSAERNCPQTNFQFDTQNGMKARRKEPKNDSNRLRSILSPSLAAYKRITGTALKVAQILAENKLFFHRDDFGSAQVAALRKTCAENVWVLPRALLWCTRPEAGYSHIILWSATWLVISSSC